MKRISAVFMGIVIGIHATLALAQVERTEVEFFNGATRLAGTILNLRDSTPMAGIVMVHGSGPGSRETLEEIGLLLAAEGVAVLIYDKRGSGDSDGDWTRSSLTDLTEDAVQALYFLANWTEPDSFPLGFWGISQGAWIVPLAANTTTADFSIVVSGGGLTPREVELARYQSIVNSMTDANVEIAAAERLFDNYFAYLVESYSYENLLAQIAALRDQEWVAASGIEQVIPTPDNRGNWSWVASFDPVDSISALTAPVLVLLGDNDPLTPFEETRNAWASSLPTEQKNEIVVFEGAGHGIRTEGHGGELMPGYVETQIEWIRTVGEARQQ